jgi:hypothetical protein
MSANQTQEKTLVRGKQEQTTDLFGNPISARSLADENKQLRERLFFALGVLADNGIFLAMDSDEKGQNFRIEKSAITHAK